MVKSHKKTRKANSRKVNKVNKSVLTIPQLRKAFDHMDQVVEKLRNKSKHSFSDAVIQYRDEWRKVFKRDLPPADAAAYLKFRYGLKSGKSKTRRSKTRGGANALAGATLDYQMRPGQVGVYGQFPSYQQEGLDRYYGSALSADCGKPNGFPVDGSAASQAGGSNGLFRPLQSGAPPGAPYVSMMETKGVVPYPTSDVVGPGPVRNQPDMYINPRQLDTHIRVFPNDIYKTTASPPGIWS